MRQAEVSFGTEPARGLFDELLKRFGPILAEILLRWLASRPFDSPEHAQASLISSETLWAWVKQMLRSYRSELIALIHDNEELLVDLLLAQLD